MPLGWVVLGAPTGYVGAGTLNIFGLIWMLKHAETKHVFAATF